jgi:hypothetical protein
LAQIVSTHMANNRETVKFLTCNISVFHYRNYTI